MGKIRLLFVLFQIFLFPVILFAQSAKIIDIKGSVEVKKQVYEPWQKASVNMLLDKGAEVRTKKDSSCTLTFDKELRNTLYIKENSNIKIGSIIPGNVLLPEGRVFALIRNIKGEEKFQIRTPTAVSGARGTGWLTDYDGSKTYVVCFEDKVYVQGLDREGNITAEQQLQDGFGMEIAEGGMLGDVFVPQSKDYNEWNEFKGNIEVQRGETEGAGIKEDIGIREDRGTVTEDIEPTTVDNTTDLIDNLGAINDIGSIDNTGDMGGLKQEQEEGNRQNTIEEGRRNEETTTTSGGGSINPP